MANQALFQTQPGALVPPADTKNAAGGSAYALSPEQALAQYAVTGTFGDTYYVGAKEQLVEALALAQKCEPMFVAKCAVYARKKGHMKDMPAFLLATLAAGSKAARNGGPLASESDLYGGHFGALRAAFPLVIDNGKMLRNFAQIVRSGVTGRKSFGTAVRRLIRNWFEARTGDQLFRDSVGEKPSIADVIKMVHPKGSTPERDALYAYLIDSKKTAEKVLALSQLVKYYEIYKEHRRLGTEADLVRELGVPDVPFQMLDSLGLDTEGWTQVAKRAGWQMLRMNLNTFARHGVLKDPEVAKAIADKLRDSDAIAKARAFPYQLLMAFKATDGNADIPMPIKLALQDAMEIATANVPAYSGGVVIAVDTSGSMQSPITGERAATSQVSCVDVAALIASCVMRRNPETLVMPFDTRVHAHDLNPRDTVMTNAQKLARYGGGGTNCSLVLQAINHQRLTPDLVIYVSDNESWMDRQYVSTGTGMAVEWAKHKAFSPKAKLVCIDLTPHANVQAKTRADTLNVGGFSDAVFEVIATFLEGKDADAFVRTIDSVELGG